MQWKEFRAEMTEVLLNPPKSDKSIKKVTKIDQVTKFINKLKSSENITESYIQDLDKYSLSKFCDDICKSLVEALL